MDPVRLAGTKPDDAEQDGAARPGARRAGASLAGVATFAIVVCVLLIRNAFLFSTRLYEDADMGANSILMEQARRFTLLVGDYSREKFNHPGPAFLYVQAWGESLFYDALHVVPTPWNGQLIALYALNALFAAFVVAIGHGWTRSVRGAAGTLAVVLGFGALHPSMFSSDWMSFVYVPAYFAFLVAIASVAAGRTRDSWIAALTGWFLIHGHACFLLFVPALTVAAVAARLWARYRRPPGPPGPPDGSPGPPAPRRWWLTWLPVAVISAVFALPMVAELALHWPGNFVKYFSYGKSSQAGGHSVARVADYVLWFWWPHRDAWAAVVLGFAVAGLLTWRLPPGPVRRFCASLLAFDALSTVVFVGYAAKGVDELSATGRYIGYFYWSAPVITVLVAVLAILHAPPVARRPALVRAAAAAAAIAAVAACAAFAIAPLTRTSTDHVDPLVPKSGPSTDAALPAVVARMAALAAGRPVVLTLQHNAWPAMTGVLVQAERAGVTACAADTSWEFMVTGQFVCSPAQVAGGAAFSLDVPGHLPRGARVIARLHDAVVTAAATGDGGRPLG